MIASTARRLRQTFVHRNGRRPLALLIGALVLVSGLTACVPTGGVTAPKALILGPSVTPGTATDASGKSLEQQQAEADGFTVDVVTTAQWQAMTAAQFAAYQVLIIGDPHCDSSLLAPPDGYPYGADVNQSTWEPVVMSSGGNKTLIGTDPTFHNSSHPGAATLEKNGIAFAGAVAGATGAYIDLSCAYDHSANGTPVPLLDGLSTHGAGQFQVGGESGGGTRLCAGDISIVAQSGPTSGLHHADLSDWICSVHEFVTKWPSDYTPLALAIDPAVPKTYAAKDVDTGADVSGSPYIMLSGGGVVISSNIALSPKTATNPVGGSHTVTATVTKGSPPVPQSGKTVTFSIDSGPNVGKTGTGMTDANGQATFTYMDTGGAGTDSISATFTDDAGALEKDTATKTWTSSGPQVSIGDVSVFEGTKTSLAEFSLTLSEPSSSPVTVSYATANDTATAPGDYFPLSGTLTFAPGTTTQKVDVPIIGDTDSEGSEAFKVNLSSPVNATIAHGTGTGTILDGPNGPANRAVGSVNAYEGTKGTAAHFTVTLSAPSTSPVTVNYAFANGTATLPGDYFAGGGSLTFAPGETAKTIFAWMNGDTDSEGSEAFTVTLSGASGADITNATGTGTVLDGI